MADTDQVTCSHASEERAVSYNWCMHAPFNLSAGIQHVASRDCLEVPDYLRSDCMQQSRTALPPRIRQSVGDPSLWQAVALQRAS